MPFTSDQFFPMDLFFQFWPELECIDPGGTVAIDQRIEGFYVKVWNPGSKDVVLKVYQEYSRDLPPENFHSQKDFLQKIADQFKTVLPRRMLNTNIVDILHNEYYRLKNDCPIHRNPVDLDEHIMKLGSLILRVQRDNRPPGISNLDPGSSPQHYNCRSVHIPISYGSVNSMIRRSMERVTDMERVRVTLEEGFRNRIQEYCRDYFRRNDPGSELPLVVERDDPDSECPEIEHHPQTLSRLMLEQASRMLVPNCHDFSKDNRFRDMEYLQRRNPSAKLWELDQQLMNRGHKPSLDHKESKVMPGKSKGVAGYIMLNDKLKKMLDQWCDLNTWKPDV